MVTSVMNMPSVPHPCFMSANKVKQEPTPQSGGQRGASTGDGDQFDFDLLAEYLLDESNTGSLAFDFGNETPPLNIQQQTGVVSPDQTTVTPFADPLADETYLKQLQSENVSDSVSHVNQMVHGIHAPTQALPQALAPPPQFKTNPPPVPQAPIHAPLAPAPPHMVHSIPTMNQTAPPLVPIPAPLAAPSRIIVHQHKRPRTDTQQPAAPIVPGNVQMMQRMLAAPRSGRQKSQAQIDRRRERNRILARRTRLRKKFFFESLQKDVTDLQKENIALKEIVRSRIASQEAKPILDRCKAMEEIPSVVLEQCGDPSLLDRQDFNLFKAIKRSQQCFVITDPSLQDNPIVYASDDFLTLTGYKRAEVLGRNCRFLQGTETCQNKVSLIRKGIDNGNDVSVTFVNYTADGTAFWNKLFIAALRDAQNNIVNYIGVIVKVAGPEPNDPEAGKMLPGESAAHDMEGQGSTGCGSTVDADATVMAIEGAVTAAVAAAAPRVVKKTTVVKSES